MDNEGLHAHTPVSTEAMGGAPLMARGGLDVGNSGPGAGGMEMSGVAAPLVGSTRRTSRVWRYFGMVDNCHYICHLCSFVGAYTNTTNMRKHIQHHHPERFQDILDHTRPTTRPFYGNTMVGIRPNPQHFTSQAHHHHPYPSAAAAAAAAALVYPHNIGAAKRMLLPKPPDMSYIQSHSGNSSDRLFNSPAVTSHPPYTNHPSSTPSPSQSCALSHISSLPSTSSSALLGISTNSYSCSVAQSVVTCGGRSGSPTNLSSVTACDLSPEETEIVSQLLPPINTECSSDSETTSRGLTGGDDRGSSEYSQNEEETTGNTSPEHFLAEANERESTPAPAAQTPPKPESYQLRHNNHLTIVLEALARDEAFMDVTLTAQGRSLKAHKSVLSAVSPYFRGVLRENPCQHPIIIMPRDVRFEELFSIVNYIYKGEMTVAAEDLTSLLKTAEILQVSGLAPSDPSSTMNPSTDLPNTGNVRSSSASSSASSNVQSIPKFSKNVKETNHGISAPPARPKSPDGMINPSDFMDMDMTYVKEEIQSGGEDDEDTATSETSAQPPENLSPKPNEMQQDSVSLSSVYNQHQEQNMASSSSSREMSNSSPVKTETETESIRDIETNKGSTENPQPFVCPYCQGQHRGVDNMANHLRLNHPTKPGFTCGCGRVFTRSMSHQAHVKVCNSLSS